MKWKSPVDITRDFLGGVAYIGQSIFAPWTLPGSVFSVRGRQDQQGGGQEANFEDEDYYYDEAEDDLEFPNSNRGWQKRNGNKRRRKN